LVPRGTESPSATIDRAVVEAVVVEAEVVVVEADVVVVADVFDSRDDDEQPVATKPSATSAETANVSRRLTML
jgi:hypothetical protein